MSPNADSDSNWGRFQNKLIHIHLYQTEYNLTLFALIPNAVEQEFCISGRQCKAYYFTFPVNKMIKI